MSESPDPSIRHDHYPTARTETIYPSRERGPATQSASQPWAHQQQWLPPPTYMPYPLGGIPYGAGYVPYLLPPQLVPSRWDDYNPFNEEETERKRKNGKELVHSSQPAISMAPWGPYPGPQGPFLGGDFGTKKAAKNVHHRDQRSVTNVQPEIRINRDVDGVLTPDSGDLTVHLDLDLQEDLDDHLDELNRLSRIGHFSHAKDFFNENLQLHIDNPYVLVHYAELLIQQGDFRGVTLLKDDVIYRHDSESPVTIEQVILRINWELMQILAKSHTLDTLIGATTIFDEAADVLTDIAKARRDTSLSSTEIKIIALMSHLTGHPALKSKWLRYGRNVLNALPSPMEKLYQSLLREGRVWDFHDLIVYMPTIEDVKAIAYHMTGHELIPSLQKMVSDWSDSIHGFDSPTTLALLDTLTYIMLEPLSISEKECIEILKICLPLAKSIMENDPQNLKSRPFLRLLLSKSRFAETASRDAVASLENHLKSSQGVFYSYDIAALPIYIPVGSEVPDWVVEDQPPELRDAVKLVLRSAKDLGDLQTEVIALKESIRLSGNPKDEFRTLCEIQRSSQGDMKAYASSLASKYLVSNFPEERETLAVDISRLLSRVSSTDYLDSSQEFVLNMLLYRLEGRSSSTIQHMLERSHIDYLNLDTHLQQEISRKMPVFKTGSDNRSQSADRTQRATTVVRPHARRNAEQSKGKRARASSARRSKDRNQTVTDSPKKEVTSALAKPPKHATIAQQQPSQPPPLTPYSPTPAAPAPVREVGNDDLQVAEINENALRKQVEAEFTLKFQKEEEYEHRQREERLAVLEALKREVDAIRKEAVEQAEKKARVEAEQRALNLKWEKERNEAEEMEHQKYLEAQAADTELLRSAREAVRRKHEELDERVRKQREAENASRREAEKKTLEEREAENELRMKAEKKVSEELMLAKRAEDERREAEAKLRQRQEAEAKARKAAEQRRAEEESIRKWATERAEKDLESKNQIHFKDAIGRKFAIPYSQGRTWQGMEELINEAFRHVEVLGPEVLAGHYDLMGPSDTIILPSTWDKIVQPGWHISMSIWPMVDSPPALPPMPPPLGQPIPSPPPAPPPFTNPPDLPQADENHASLPRDLTGAEASGPRSSAASDDNDASSEGYSYVSSFDEHVSSRRRRIANAWSSLKHAVFQRRRRASVTTTESLVREELVDS